jgi:hypothetical protein
MNDVRRVSTRVIVRSSWRGTDAWAGRGMAVVAYHRSNGGAE